ncbi:MAG: hypothetical protein Q9161_003836 [Pseudevernia consocians]
MSREERATVWPTMFSAKGALRSGYIHKGQAAKVFDSEINNFKYALLDGPEKLKDVGAVVYSLIAQIQNVKYEIIEATTSEPAARLKKSNKVARRSTRRTYQSKKIETDEEIENNTDPKKNTADENKSNESEENDQKLNLIDRIYRDLNKRAKAAKRKADVTVDASNKRQKANTTPRSDQAQTPTQSKAPLEDEWAASPTPTKESAPAPRMLDILQKTKPEVKLQEQLRNMEK